MKSAKFGEIIESQSMVGGGSLPGETLPTWVWAIEVEHPQKLLELLREGEPAVIARVENDKVILDPRTVLPEADPVVIDQLHEAWRKYEEGSA
jgi:L-seryl-tRNA(Ser) seleniumtransferase